MDKASRNSLSRFLFDLTEKARPSSDEELLALFINTGNETAFEGLVKRHGPMVRRVCRGVLGNDNDVDDVFQATFLALAKKPGSLRKQDALAPWLHSVAFRLSQQALRMDRRRRFHEAKVERPAAEPDLQEEVSLQEARAALDAAIDGLPDAVRQPVILHCLEGMTYDDAAARLGVSTRTFQRRLGRGRKLLQSRLKPKGIDAVSVLLLYMVGNGAKAAIPPGLAASTAQLAAAFIQGTKLTTEQAAIALLAQAGIAGWSTSGLKLAASLVLGTAVVTAGGAVLVHRWAAERERADPVVAFRAVEAKRVASPALARVAAAAKGPATELTGQVLDVAGKPVAHALVVALAREPWRPGEQGLRDNVLAKTQADAEGRFRFQVRADFPSWMPERRVQVMASAPGHALSAVELPLHGDKAQAVLRLPPPRAISGKLVDSEGLPAAGVRVHVVRAAGVAREPVQGAELGPDPPGWAAPAVSDADGCFSIDGVNAKEGVWLQFQHERFALQSVNLDDFAGQGEGAFTVKLEPAQEVNGRIVAQDTGKPLSGIRLTMTAGEAPTFAFYHSPGYGRDQLRARPVNQVDARTDAEGRFHLHPPPGKHTQLQVYPPEGSPYLAIGGELRWGEAVFRQDISVALPRGVFVEGSIMDADSGAPIAGGKVFYCPSKVFNDPKVPRGLLTCRDSLTTADARGKFGLPVLPGKGWLLVYGPRSEYRSEPFVMRLSDDPKAEAINRWYAHAVVPIDASPQRSGSGKVNPSCTVTARLKRGQELHGRVLDADGKPAVDALVLSAEQVSPMRSGAEVQPIPVRDGKFVFGGCESGVVYPLVFVDPKRKQGVVAHLSLPSSGKATGASKEPVVRLRLCGDAQVRLVRPDGSPAGGYAVELRIVLDRCFGATGPDMLCERDGDPHLASCYDAVNDHGKYVADARGGVTIPALVPDACYQLRVAADGSCREIRASDGEHLLLSFVVKPERDVP